jgi:selenocysteine-specific elongation factor
LSRATAESLFAKNFIAGEAPAGAAIEAALARLLAEKSIRPDGPLWKASSAVRDLSPDETGLLARLKAAGKTGLEPGRTTAQSDARALKSLCSFGEARPLDGGIFMARDAFDACVEAILRGKKSGDRFTVGDAKERSSLSRKYILPLLNRMETDGLVKRYGDERIVL